MVCEMHLKKKLFKRWRRTERGRKKGKKRQRKKRKGGRHVEEWPGWLQRLQHSGKETVSPLSPVCRPPRDLVLPDLRKAHLQKLEW